MEKQYQIIIFEKFSKKYFTKIYNTFSFHPAFSLVLEIIGIHSILELSIKILLKKMPTIDFSDEINILKTEHFFLKIVENVIKNYTRHSIIKNEILKIQKTSRIDNFNDSKVISYFIEREDLNSQDKILNRLIDMTGKIYSAIHEGNKETFENYIRYYKKLNGLINDEKQNIAFRANLHQIKAFYFFDFGKLNLSKKHSTISIDLFKNSDNIFNHSFISTAYNMAGLVELNQKKYSSGEKTFHYNINELVKLMNTGFSQDEMNVNELNLAKTRILFGMFSGNIPTLNKNKILQDSFNVNVASGETIFSAYAEACIYLDTGRFHEAIDLLENELFKEKRVSYEGILNKIRINIALAEAYTYGFTSKINKEIVMQYCEKVESERLHQLYPYFIGIVKILKGYIISKTDLISEGFDVLKANNYYHYFTWYKRKF